MTVLHSLKTQKTFIKILAHYTLVYVLIDNQGPRLFFSEHKYKSQTSDWSKKDFRKPTNRMNEFVWCFWEECLIILDLHLTCHLTERLHKSAFCFLYQWKDGSTGTNVITSTPNVTSFTSAFGCRYTGIRDDAGLYFICLFASHLPAYIKYSINITNKINNVQTIANDHSI